MKCPGCGSNLTIDDEKCQFCGQASPFAVKHRKEMKRFTHEFNKTREEVLNESRKFNHWSVKIALIAVLVAINVVLLFFNVYPDGVEDFLTERKIQENYLIHKEQLDKYEKEQNFVALSKYFDRNRLYYSDLFKEYRAVSDICGNYSYLFRYVMQVHTEELSDTYMEDMLEYISGQLDSIYLYYLPRAYHDEEQYKPQHQECMIAAKEQAEALLQTYFNLTDAEIESFETLSEARRQILMEEGLERNE